MGRSMEGERHLLSGVTVRRDEQLNSLPAESGTNRQPTKRGREGAVWR